jgi:hypothetical protein
MRSRALCLFGSSIAVLALAAACSKDEPAPAANTTATATGSGGAGGADGDDKLVCPEAGVSKGPWALAVDATNAKIRWEACAPGTSHTLSYAKEGGGAEATIEAIETAFQVNKTYRAPLNADAPPDYAGTYYMHEAKLTGLDAGACYTYALKSDPARKGRFCTARPSGDALRFMAIGDTNPALGDSTKNVLKYALAKNPDFVLHGGDIQYYASGLETWAFWFDAMQPMLSQGAMYAAIGNHEFEKADEFEQYTERFFANSGFDGTSAYYRFQSAGVWFFALDTEQSLAADSEQWKWFEPSLADAAGKLGYRFSVVYFHRPAVTCGDTSDDPELTARLTPLLKQHKAPLVLQAHMHGYERFEIEGITYITTAGGGGLMGDVSANKDRATCKDRVIFGPYKHAMIFDVAGGELTGQAIDEDGAVVDSFTKALP